MPVPRLSQLGPITFERALGLGIAGLGVATAIYILLYSQTRLQTGTEHQDIVLGASLLMIFLATLRRRRRSWPILSLLLFLSVLSTAYVRVFHDDLWMRQGSPNTLDVIIGIILVVVVLEAARQSLGWIIPLFTTLFIAYLYLAQLFPHPFYLPPIPLSKVVSFLSIGWAGIFGPFLSAAAEYIFLFVVLGGLLQVTGATDFFIELGRLAATKVRSGPGQASVVSSALFGMVTGTSMGNVAVDGIYNIPLMKRTGYTSEEAGAIEAATSNGGQIMPPIMGAAVFLMAVIIGIPYSVIMLRGFIPAILYFLAIAFGVHFLAVKRNLRPAPGNVDTGLILRRAPLFGIPVLILVILLLVGRSPTYAAFWAIVAAILLGFFRREIRGNPLRILDGLAKGAGEGASLIATVGCLGMIYSILSLSGLGLKIGGAIEGWSGGNVIIALFIAMSLTVFLGMGASTLADYAIVAIMAGPILVRMGVDIYLAHMFIFMFAVTSSVTPPVAPAALVAAQISGGNYISTALAAMRISLLAYLVAWLMIWNPAIAGVIQDPAMDAIWVLSAIFFVLALQMANYGYFIHKMSPGWRIETIVAALALAAAILLKNPGVAAVGAVLLFAACGWQWRQSRTLARALVPG